MNATRWQAITNPVKMWRKWHKLKGQVKALEERVAELERIIQERTADS